MRMIWVQKAAEKQNSQIFYFRVPIYNMYTCIHLRSCTIGTPVTPTWMLCQSSSPGVVVERVGSENDRKKKVVSNVVPIWAEHSTEALEPIHHPHAHLCILICIYAGPIYTRTHPQSIYRNTISYSPTIDI
jgi:hypothetical protein